MISTSNGSVGSVRSVGEKRWYLVHCKPREDRRALVNLEQQGFECYAPVRPVERLRGGVRCTASEPLFPGYLFIYLDQVNDNWVPISSTRGVHQIVRFNQHPAPVRDEIVEGIRAHLAGLVPAQPYLMPGQRVRITQGAFSQLEAVFVASDGKERVLLLLNIMHSEQTLSFPIQSVRKVTAGRVERRRRAYAPRQ